jgi:hypothetical protein
MVTKAPTLDPKPTRRVTDGFANSSAAGPLVFRVLWHLANASLVIAILLAFYTIGWEFSTRRYLTGFSDAIVPATAPADEKIEAILTWMAHGPARRPLGSESLLMNRDPTDTLNYDALLRVCGTATNAFINLVDSGGLESRRLLLVDSNQKTNHVVTEVWVDGRWIVVDPAYRLILRGPNGNPLTREELEDPVTFERATGDIPGYNPAYNYQYTLHVHLGHFPVIGRPLQAILDRALPGWQDSALMTLFLERLSFGAMVAAALLVLFLALFRIIVRWYGEKRLGIRCPRARNQLRQASGAFLRTADGGNIRK